MSDYGDACATLRTGIRSELARICHVTGIVHGDKSEAIVEAVVKMLHDNSVAWAIREIIDRNQTQG